MPTIMTLSGLKNGNLSDLGILDDEFFEPTNTKVTTSRHTKAELLKSVGWLHRCIHLRANAVMTMPFVISKNETVVYHSGTAKLPDELAWLKTFKTMLYRTEASLCLNNRAYWFIKQTRSKPVELKYMAAKSIDDIWDPSKGLVSYVRRLEGSGVGQPLSLEDVVNFSFLDPDSETGYLASPVEAAMGSASVLKSVDGFTSKFFDRGAIKATILTVEGNPSPRELRRLETWWRRFFQGIQQAWEAAAVRAAVKPVVVGEGLESLTNSSLTNEKREDISTTLGIPHSMVQSNAATYATALQDRRAFYDDTVIPEVTMFEVSLQQQLFERFGYTFRFLPEELAIYQEDEEQRSLAWRNYVDGGVKPSIAAQMLGLHLPEGISYEDLDDRVLPVQVQPQIGKGTQSTATRQPATGVQSEDAKATEITRLKHWLKNRVNPDLGKFKSAILTDEEIAQVAVGVRFIPKSSPQVQVQYVTKSKTLSPKELSKQFNKALPKYEGLLDA